MRNCAQSRFVGARTPEHLPLTIRRSGLQIQEGTMPPKRPSPSLQARLAVLTGTLGTAAGLLRIGYPPITATLITLGGAAWPAAPGCR